MKELLQKRLAAWLNINPEDIKWDSDDKGGSFSLHDCAQCPPKKKSACDSEEILRVDSKCLPVTAIRLDDTLKLLRNTLKRSQKNIVNKQSICDYLMTDAAQRKIVFCELTCSRKEYVDGPGNKRDKAREQMKKSVEFVLKDPGSKECRDCWDYAAKCNERVCLFAWRAPLSPTDSTADPRPQEDNNPGTRAPQPPTISTTDSDRLSPKNMQNFHVRQARNVAPLLSEAPIAGLPFKTVEVQFPTVYEY